MDRMQGSHKTDWRMTDEERDAILRGLPLVRRAKPCACGDALVFARVAFGCLGFLVGLGLGLFW